MMGWIKSVYYLMVLDNPYTNKERTMLYGKYGLILHQPSFIGFGGKGFEKLVKCDTFIIEHLIETKDVDI